MSAINSQFDNNTDIFTFILLVNCGANDISIKKKLDKALEAKLQELELRRETICLRQCGPKPKKDRRRPYEKQNYKGIGTQKKPLDHYNLRRKEKTLMQEERALHESYQILLSEYPKRLRQSLKHRNPP